MESTRETHLHDDRDRDEPAARAHPFAERSDLSQHERRAAESSHRAREQQRAEPDPTRREGMQRALSYMGLRKDWAAVLPCRMGERSGTEKGIMCCSLRRRPE